MAKSTKKSSEIVTLDRRNAGDRREKSGRPNGPPQGVAERTVSTERRQKKPRRRQIDPTTCERDYSDLEIQFMQAMDAYKHQTGNRFPSCGEVLEIVARLDYAMDREVDDPEEALAKALEKYKQTSGRMFPTCSEVLEVIIGMGYRQQAGHLDAVACGGVIEASSQEK